MSKQAWGMIVVVIGILLIALALQVSMAVITSPQQERMSEWSQAMNDWASYNITEDYAFETNMRVGSNVKYDNLNGHDFEIGRDKYGLYVSIDGAEVWRED